MSMQRTVQIIIWCDWQDLDHIVSHINGEPRFERCVEEYETINVNKTEAYKEAREWYGWSRSKGLYFCSDHKKKRGVTP